MARCRLSSCIDTRTTYVFSTDKSGFVSVCFDAVFYIWGVCFTFRNAVNLNEHGVVSIVVLQGGCGANEARFARTI